MRSIEGAGLFGLTLREALATLDVVAERLPDAERDELIALAVRAAIAHDNLAAVFRVLSEEARW
jgi:hypothetical protein